MISGGALIAGFGCICLAIAMGLYLIFSYVREKIMPKVEQSLNQKHTENKLRLMESLVNDVDHAMIKATFPFEELETVNFVNVRYIKVDYERFIDLVDNLGYVIRTGPEHCTYRGADASPSCTKIIKLIHASTNKTVFLKLETSLASPQYYDVEEETLVITELFMAHEEEDIIGFLNEITVSNKEFQFTVESNTRVFDIKGKPIQVKNTILKDSDIAYKVDLNVNGTIYHMNGAEVKDIWADILGNNFHTIFSGAAGTGKTKLAYSLLNEISGEIGIISTNGTELRNFVHKQSEFIDLVEHVVHSTGSERIVCLVDEAEPGLREKDDEVLSFYQSVTDGQLKAELEGKGISVTFLLIANMNTGNLPESLTRPSRFGVKFHFHKIQSKFTGVIARNILELKGEEEKDKYKVDQAKVKVLRNTPTVTLAEIASCVTTVAMEEKLVKLQDKLKNKLHNNGSETKIQEQAPVLHQRIGQTGANRPIQRPKV